MCMPIAVSSLIPQFLHASQHQHSTMTTLNATQAAPIFRAVASSTRPIQQLLKCISFTNKVHVEIGEDNIKFAADQSRVMQGGSRRRTTNTL